MAAIDLRQLATNALAFTVAIAWNDAMAKIASAVYPEGDFRYSFVRAALITLTVIFIILIANWLMTKPSGEELDNELDTDDMKKDMTNIATKDITKDILKATT